MERLEQKVREVAYHKWKQAGSPVSDGVYFWVEAEKQVLSNQKKSADKKSVKKK